MFYGFFPPWAVALIVIGVIAIIVLIVCMIAGISQHAHYGDLKQSGARSYYTVSLGLAVIAAASLIVASIQAYNSQVALYNQATTAQSLIHVDAIDGVHGSMHVYNTAGNCWVYAKYDPYQKSVILDANQLRNGSISLNGTTVYSLTTKPLSQEGIDQLCEANYGEEAFNNNDE